MLEVFVKLINSLILSIAGYFVIKKILKQKDSKIRVKEFIIFFLSAIITVIIYRENYEGINTILIFLFNIIIYKILFDITIDESVISTSILMMIIFVIEIILSLIYMPFISVKIARTNLLISFFSNVIVSIFCVMILKIKCIEDQLTKFYRNIVSKRVISIIIYFTLIVIGFSYLFYNIGTSNFFNKEYILNLITIVIFIVLTYIFICNKNNYSKLEKEYDTLFLYTQNFEEWIEKEQLNRHEYKNQLAVLRCLTTEKKVKEKIDEILADNINIEDQAVTQLKVLPKGGIKGLMYYKAAVAQKYKLNLTADVSIEQNGILTKLTEKEIRVLCKLIGIYFDNAIEAEKESRKKNISVEIYEWKDKINIIFSNTFKRHKNMKDRNKKGISSKGEGRGYGLYFASKLLKENSWIEESQEIIDKYYIEKIIIKKQNKKKGNS